jgi:hypothetical protein
VANYGAKAATVCHFLDDLAAPFSRYLKLFQNGRLLRNLIETALFFHSYSDAGVAHAELL